MDKQEGKKTNFKNLSSLYLKIIEYDISTFMDISAMIEENTKAQELDQEEDSQ